MVNQNKRSHTWRTIIALSLVSLVPTDYQCYATCQELTYIRPLQWMGEDKMLVRMAPLDYRLDVPYKFCTLILTGGQFAQALPYDRTLRNMPSHDCREEVEANAMRIRCLLDQQSGTTSSSTDSVPDVQDEESAQSPAPFQNADKPEPVMYFCDGPEIVLSNDIIQQAHAAMKDQFQNQRLSTRNLPLLLLRTALLVIVQQMDGERSSSTKAASMPEGGATQGAGISSTIPPALGCYRALRPRKLREN